MGSSDTGYVCKEALYPKYNQKYYIDGNYYVYAGDEYFLLCFYKGYFYVISDGVIIYSWWNGAFVSETLYFNNLPSVKVEYLDKTLHVEYMDKIEQPWKEYVKEYWVDATGDEPLSELQGGHKAYRRYLKRIKKWSRQRKTGIYKYRKQRWLATWEYNGRKYEVIFGYGIEPNEEVWNNIKHELYDFSDIERKIINEWFKEDK